MKIRPRTAFKLLRWAARGLGAAAGTKLAAAALEALRHILT